MTFELQSAIKAVLAAHPQLAQIPIICEAQADYAKAARNAAEADGGVVHIILRTPDGVPEMPGQKTPVSRVTLQVDITFPPAAQELEGPSPDTLQYFVLHAICKSDAPIITATDLTFNGFLTLEDPRTGDYIRRLPFQTVINLL